MSEHQRMQFFKFDIHLYLVLTEFEVCTVRYGPRWEFKGKKRGFVTCVRTE